MQTIVPGVDYFAEVLVAATDDPDAGFTPAANESGVRVVFAATESGPAITGALSVECTDIGATKTVSGQLYQIYQGTLLGSDSLAALDPFAFGTIIYQRTEIGAHSRAAVPLKIAAQ